MWAQGIIRFVASGGSPEFLNLILPEKVSDVVLTWAISIIAGLAVMALAYFVFRKRKRLGSIRVWTVVLLLSAIFRYI